MNVHIKRAMRLFKHDPTTFATCVCLSNLIVTGVLFLALAIIHLILWMAS